LFAIRDILTGAGWTDISQVSEFSAMVGITRSTLDNTLQQFGLQSKPLPSAHSTHHGNQSSTNSDSTSPPPNKRVRSETTEAQGAAGVESIGEAEGSESEVAIDMLKRTQNGYKFTFEGVPVLNTTLTCRILLAMVMHKDPHNNFDTSGTTLILEILKFHYFNYNFIDILPEHALRLMRCDAIVDAIIKLLAKERIAIPQNLTSPITDPKDLLSNHNTIPNAI
jgi:hypothetical protein